ncbi:type I cytoskeletal 13-like protein [Labeo rohita]|uniref:Type I cytoskeletal 13-like protein n=1 Tax=Labeo rohita TaxID=84645 RepID=A0A498LAZ0_LABRO|nr:keratin 98 [Labeo rohita]RXN03644.1 type I cytoskeletal 13-like protein [Labeo rohita]RXN24542.1 type I cytoskeletal 13-like protein [Labeo rohita]
MSYSSSRALSVYGGAGGRETKVSSSPSGVFYSSPRGFNLADGLDPCADEKATMQNLNSRLANYLEKVHSLEKANAELEKKIREWYESRTEVTFDHSLYLDAITDLRNKIQLASQDNATLMLSADNSKLAADDFKLKYENELAMRRAIEADITNLRKILDDFSLKRSDLEIQIEALNEELIMLKRNHKEEMSLARAEAGGQVNVSVDAAPSMDLNQAMTEIRQHYETVTEKNRKELESWYEKKIATVQQEVVVHNEGLQNSGTELKELTNVLQRLQIELQTHQSMKSTLDGELEETQARYWDELTRLQTTVTNLEDQLSQFHANIANNKREYETLLDVKTRLEREIEEYRRLLNGEERESHKIVTKTITVVETIVDGNIVESSESVSVNETED